MHNPIEVIRERALAFLPNDITLPDEQWTTNPRQEVLTALAELAEAVRLLDEISAHAPMGHHLYATDEEWHTRLRRARALLTPPAPLPVS